MGFLRGIYHPRPVRDRTYKGITFREDEVAGVEEDVVGLPVWVEHDKTLVIGHVDSVRRSVHDTLECDIYIDESHPLGRLVMRDVRAGILRGLSIGFFGEKHSPIHFDDIGFTEVSVVVEGRLPDTIIYAYDLEDGTVVIDRDALSSLRGEECRLHNIQHSLFSRKMSTDPKFQAAQETANQATNPDTERELAELRQFKADKLAAERAQEIAMSKARVDQTVQYLYDEQDGLVTLAKRGEVNTGMTPAQMEAMFPEVGQTDNGLGLLKVTCSVVRDSRLITQKYKDAAAENDRLKSELNEKNAMIQKLAERTATPMEEVDIRHSRAPATSATGSASYRAIFEKAKQKYVPAALPVSVKHSAASASGSDSAMSFRDMVRQAASTAPIELVMAKETGL